MLIHGKNLNEGGTQGQYSGGLRFMKNKLNLWIINIFLTVVTSFLLNGGLFAGHTEGSSLSKGGMGTIKLSGKNLTTHVKSESSIVPRPFRKHFGQGKRAYAQQKGGR